MRQPYTLTETEIKFLKLIAGGFSSPEAGKILGMKTKTASTHADHIREQMNVRKIHGAAMLALQFEYFYPHEITVRLKDPSLLPMCKLPKAE